MDMELISILGTSALLIWVCIDREKQEEKERDELVEQIVKKIKR